MLELKSELNPGKMILEVLDASGEVITKVEAKNLILDSGVSALMGSGLRDFRASYSSDTTPVKDRDTGITASQSGLNVTLSSSLTGVGIGTVIKWDSGEEAYVVSGSGTSWVVDRVQTVSAGLFSNFRVNRTSVSSPVAPTSSSFSVTTSKSGTVFTTVATTVSNFNSVGASTSINSILIKEFNTSANFAIIVLPTTVNLLTGQQPRITYVFTSSIDTAPVSTSMNITGFGTVTGKLGWLSTTEPESGWYAEHKIGAYYMELSATQTSSSSASFPAFGGGTAGMGYMTSTAVSHTFARTLSTWTRTQVHKFGTTQANGTWYYVGIMAEIGYYVPLVFAFRFDTPFIKSNLHEWTVTFVRSLTRNYE